MSQKISALILATLLLGACDTMHDLFQKNDDKRQPGERISILQLQKELTPNVELEKKPMQLPAVWENKLWPQRGGYPTHVMGHLALGDNIKPVWSVSVGAGADDRSPLMAPPVVADEKVFTLDADGDVSSFTLATGKRLWQRSIVPKEERDTQAIGGGLTFDTGKIYATGGHKYLVALNAENGEMVWKLQLPAAARLAPTVLDGRIYVTTIDNQLLAYNAEDSKLLWKYTGISETTGLLGAASPAADENIVVLPLSTGEIFGLTPDQGIVLWQDNLSAVRRGGAMASISDIRALPIIDQSVVYAVSYSGRMVALDKATGERLWQREISSAETPWSAGDTLFLLTQDQHLAALDKQSGDTRWVLALPRHVDKDTNDIIVWAGPVLAGGRLFVVSSAEEMIEVDPALGTILKKHTLSSKALMAPVVAEQTLLVLTDNGTLTAFR